MSRQTTLLIVAGARPNFMKVAPLIHALARRARTGDTAFRHFLVHSGQHYDPGMSAVFFKELGIPAPNVNLGVGSGTHAVQTAHVMLRFEKVCDNMKPDWVIVVGDVNSTLACTLVCAKRGIRVAHVEAGLRSGDRSMPEEVNRIVTDALADLLLTPSPDANANLRREGIPEGRIRFVGNVMIDSLVANLARMRKSQIGQSLGLTPGAFVYVTLHRPANVDDASGLAAIMQTLAGLARQRKVVFPVHPRTHAMLERIGLPADAARGLVLVEPIGYHDSLWLSQNASFVLTDSGGIQEETTYLGTPCLTLRPTTERPITIEIGTNRLTSLERLATDIEDLVHGMTRPGKIPELWDGHAAERIVDALQEAADDAAPADTP